MAQGLVIEVVKDKLQNRSEARVGRFRIQALCRARSAQCTLDSPGKPTHVPSGGQERRGGMHVGPGGKQKRSTHPVQFQGLQKLINIKLLIKFRGS